MTQRLGTITFLLVGLLAARSDLAGAQLQGQVIRIGIGAPLTGGAASFGVEMKNAVELAVDEENIAGGVLGARIETRAFDDEASDATGQAAYDPGVRQQGYLWLTTTNEGLLPAL